MDARKYMMKWRQAHPDYAREWRQRNKEKCREYERTYKRKHPEDFRAIRRRYYHKHIEKCREAARIRYHRNPNKWMKMYPDRAWAIQGLARHRRKGYNMQMSYQDLLKLLHATKTCRICGKILDPNLGRKPLSPSIDIIDPHIKKSSPSNVQIICRQCNVSKLDRSMEEFVDYCRLVIERLT